MAAVREPAKRIIQKVRPILSIDREESRRRVFNLYKAWYRTAPFIGNEKIKTNVFKVVLIVVKRLISN